MDIYVVSLCWWRDGSSVIGAATEREIAEEIANRSDHGMSEVASWAPWRTGRTSVGQELSWFRDALTADGTNHPSLYQQIVKVPLAGSRFPEKDDPLKDWRTIRPIDDRPLADRLTDARPSLEEFTSAMGKLHEFAKSALPPDEIRVGNGAMLAHIRRALGTLKPNRSGGAAESWSPEGGFVAGLRIVIDPTMPPHMMRVGDQVYVLGDNCMYTWNEKLLIKYAEDQITTPRG